METRYFIRQGSPSLWRSTGPGDVQRWTNRRGTWTLEPDTDGEWLWRASGFGGWTEYEDIIEAEARRRFPAAFPELDDGA